MDQTLYDEFGNYIGPDLEDDEDEEEEDISDRFEEDEPIGGDKPHNNKPAGSLPDISANRAIVPHEEKKYYPEGSEVYPGVETLVEDEDTQPLTEPIIAPVRTKDFDAVEKALPITTFSYDFLANMMYQPDRIRQICFLGNLHW